MKFIVALILLTGTVCFGADNPDSSLVARRLHELSTICRTVDFADSTTQELGFFHKVAPYIVYRGEDRKRKWKDVCNYKNDEDKKGVDAVCERVNRTINQDTSYSILSYQTKKEVEGTWHALVVQYRKKGQMRTSIFAFLKIKDNFLLGDID